MEGTGKGGGGEASKMGSSATGKGAASPRVRGRLPPEGRGGTGRGLMGRGAVGATTGAMHRRTTRSRSMPPYGAEHSRSLFREEWVLHFPAKVEGTREVAMARRRRKWQYNTERRMRDGGPVFPSDRRPLDTKGRENFEQG